MKKFFVSIILLIAFIPGFSAGLTGTKYITSYNSHTADYNTLAAAIYDLNANGVGTGGVVFMMPPGYTETFTNATVAAGAGVPTGYTISNGGVSITTTSGTAANTIVFQKDTYTTGANPKITSGNGNSAADAIITISGASYITFNRIDLANGNNPSSATAPTTTTNNNIMEFGYYIKNSGTVGATNNTIKNCTVKLYNYKAFGNTTVTGGGACVFQNNGSSTSTAANSNNTYDSIFCTSAYRGIYIKGDATYPDQSVQIINCPIGASGTVGDIGHAGSYANNPTGLSGIEVSNQQSITVAGNEIQNVQYAPTGSQSAAICGMYLNGLYGTCSINSNKVHDIYNLNSSSGSASTTNGILVNGASGATVSLYNNSVYLLNNVNTSGGTAPCTFGIQIMGSGTASLYHNSIYLSSASTCNTACVYESTTTVTVNLLNNIFKNASTGGGIYSAVYIINSGLVGTIDWNDYDVAGSASNPIGYKSNVKVTTIAAWRTATAQDLNSLQFTANFKGTGDLHINMTSCTADPNYYCLLITTPVNISTDIDGDTRSYTYMGSDEPSTANVQIATGSNHPGIGSVAIGDVYQILFHITVTAPGASTNFTGLTVTTGNTSSPGFAYTPGTNDFKNFTLWGDSVNSSYNAATSFRLGNVTTAAPAIGGSIAFTSGLNLPYKFSACKTYNLFITCDVGSTGAATSGANIDLIVGATTTDLSNITFSSGTKTGSVNQAGYQYIASIFYNDANVDPILPSSWHDPISNSNPTTFVKNYQVFRMIATPDSVMSTPWQISGVSVPNSAKLIIGDTAVSPANVIFYAQQTYTGIADVLNKGTLKFKNTNPALTTLGTLAVGSTVHYDSTMNHMVTAANYYNLILSGARSTNTITLPTSGTVGIAGTFIPMATGSTPYTVTSSKVSFNGTAGQYVPGFTYNILDINNSCAASLSVTTGSDTARCIINTGVTVIASSYTITAGNLLVRGTIDNNSTSISAFAATVNNSNLGFASGSYYNLKATLTGAATGQIPPATWHANSNIKISSVTTGTNIGDVGTPGAGGFGNVTYDNGSISTAVFRLFQTFPATTTIAGTLTLLRTNNSPTTNVTQLFGTSGATSATAAYINLNCGNWMLNNGAYTNIMSVLKDFRMVDSMSAVAGYIAPVLSFGTSGTATFNVGGNFLMTKNTGTPVIKTAGNAGSIVFNGTGAQTVSSNTGAAMLTISSGTLTSTLGTSSSTGNNVTLSSGIYNPGSLTFYNSGTHYFTAATGTVLNPGGTLITNAPANGYVITSGTGRLKYQGTLAAGSSYLFPVGISTSSYNPITINPIVGPDVFAVNVLSAPNFSTSVAPSFTSQVVNVQYFIDKTTTNASDTAVLTFEWKNAASNNEAPVFDRTMNVVMARFDSAASTKAWIERGLTTVMSAATPNGINTWTASMGWKIFNVPFGVGNVTSFNAILLPLELVSFGGKTIGNINQLAWKTAKEVSVKEYIVERGLDGTHFAGIGNVTAKNISGQNEYGFDDKLVPADGIVYYRLKIIGKDGQYKYSQVIALNFKKGAGVVQVFPNPVRNNLFITHDKAVAGASAVVFTVTGNKMAECPVIAGAMQTTVNTASLPAGVYLLKYQNNGQVQIVRFAKL